ncbi:sugar phosphate isomerase/epimerase [Humibacter antri]
MAQIGVQAMMLRDDIARDGVFPVMEAVRDIGYRAVEVSQIPMTPNNVAELGRAKDGLELTIGALSASLSSMPGRGGESLTDDFDKIVGDAEALGCSMLRIGMLPFDAMRSLDTVLDFCDRSDEMALRLAERGIRLYYHNHHIEFTKYDGRFLLDIIADRAPNMGLEVDVHWVHRGGLDPVKTLRKYGERVAMVHLKDYRIGKLSEEAFALLESGDFQGFMNAFTGVVQFAEVGEGNLDFSEIIPVSQEIGARYLLVEQDDQYGRTPLDCLRTSHDNLVALGFSDLF